MRHHPEAARRERQEERRLDDMPPRQREHSIDRDGSAGFDERDDVVEKTADPPLVNGEQKLFLARKIKIDGPLRESRVVGDFGAARDALRRMEEYALGPVEDRVVAFPLVFGLDGALANDHDVPCLLRSTRK